MGLLNPEDDSEDVLIFFPPGIAPLLLLKQPEGFFA